MNLEFALQLLASFVIGGALVSGLSIIAERVSQQVAGIILMLPSTVIVAFFFMGLISGTNAVVQAVPGTLVTMAIPFFLFAITYVLFAQIPIRNRLFSIFLSTVCGTCAWLVTSIPIAKWQIDNMPLAICIFITGVIIFQYFLSVHFTKSSKSKTAAYSIFQKFLRAIIAGTVIVSIVLISKILGPFWGGVVAAFPAATLSAFAILHWQHGSIFLFHATKTMPIGIISIGAYVITVRLSFPLIGVIGGTVAAVLCSSLVAIAVQKTAGQILKQ